MFQEDKRFVDYIKVARACVCVWRSRKSRYANDRPAVFFEIFDHIRPLSFLLFKETFLGFIDCG